MPAFGNVEAYWLDDNLFCFKKQNVAYVSQRCNASTFYDSVVIENGWQEIKYSEINWQQDAVFGLIQDPINRYCKGLAADLLCDEMLKNSILPLFDKITSGFVPITLHTLPISLTCGDKYQQIHWIPIDQNVSSEELVVKFCKKNNLNLEINKNMKTFNAINPDETALYLHLKKLLGDANHIFYKIFSKDIDLYHSVSTQ